MANDYAIEPVGDNTNPFKLVDVQSDSNKILIDALDTIPDYTVNKIVPGDSIIELVASSDSAESRLLKTLVNIDNLITTLDTKTTLTATPKGDAGGDLTGTYPDPIVRQITGTASSLVYRAVTDSSGTTEQSWDTYGGYGLAVGSIYKLNKITNTKTSVKAWIATHRNNLDMKISIDDWKTCYNDTTFQTVVGSPGSNGILSIAYVYLTWASSNAWVVFRSDVANMYYYLLDVPSSYTDDGNFVASAWTEKQDCTGLKPDITHVVSHNGITFVSSGTETSLYYTIDWITFSVAFASELHIGGVGTDDYGTFMLTIRNKGYIYYNKSAVNGGTFNPTSWTRLQLTNGLTVDGVPADNLPVSVAPVDNDSNTATWWTTIRSSYGLWITYVGFQYNTSVDKTYAYSENGYDWITYKDAALTSFAEAATDGTRWFATNFTSDYEPVKPIVYQLLLDTVSAHKRLACEKGITVDGDSFFSSILSAPALATDANGKLISASPSITARSLYNYTPVTLAAGVATDIIALASTYGTKTVPAQTAAIKYMLNYNLYCPTASTSWILTLKLGTVTLFTGTATGQTMMRNLTFINDITNNLIYTCRNTISDSTAAAATSSTTFTAWSSSQALSLTVQPTAAGKLLLLEGGYAQ